MRPTAEELAAELALEPHPEGGFFRETYRATEMIRTSRGERAASTAILFLLTASSPSRFHRLRSDELWVFQVGSPLELVTIDAAGAVQVRRLARPVGAGVESHAVVRADVWQAARVLADGAPQPGGAAVGDLRWSLVTCVVTPGFDFVDLELGRSDELTRLCPEQAELIAALT
jgi:predicted cupin superfamily sugar epimerase